MRTLRHSVAALSALLAAPPALAALALRPAWRDGLGERLGGGPRPAPGGVWLHGASVGEALLVAPFLPETAPRILERLGIPDALEGARLPDDARWGGLRPGTPTTKGPALFPRIDPLESDG